MKNLSSEHLRKSVLDMAYSGGTVHIACAFSIIEICAVIYEKFLNLGSSIKDEDRDIFALSKGHGVMAVYACLKEIGYLTADDLAHYFKDGTKLKGLSDCHVPGLEVTSGSLGHGLSVAVGMALASKLKKNKQKIYCVVGDGESNEGSIWEAILFAAHWKLDNLTIIFDCNGFQAMGSIADVMEMDSLKKKLEAFNFETLEIDGHNRKEIEESLSKLNVLPSQRPKALIARTVKGKGISFMHANNEWHYTRLNQQTYAAALSELGFKI